MRSRPLVASIFVSVLVFKTWTSFGQEIDNTRQNNERNLYFDALKHIVTNSASIVSNAGPVYYEQYGFIDSLPLFIGNKRLISATPKILKSIGAAHGCIVYKVFPLVLENGQFYVPIVPFDVSYNRKKSNLQYTNPGTIRIAYRFVQNHFVFMRLENHLI